MSLEDSIDELINQGESYENIKDEILKHWVKEVQEISLEILERKFKQHLKTN